ncbi:putative C6 transcription factor [Talaromyces proteolyticus]|uniref:C6 transcription factor n=1 Tax=Talaromyces proteolyticus TaxID=1131652 RepID=A0AAD4KRD9_9EURO|nr:putative C6 transcription factor [Talaromyces proteolyticus]KAH8698749.1 putative C6 transcription factor [Talaromyces proteolyticus]
MTSFSSTAASAGGQAPGSLAASSFRNVSACNRCRLRKNRCDQRLPRCQACEKADVKCVGYDPITKREIPRSYVYFLEARVTYLERLLLKNGVEFKPSAAFDGEMEEAGANVESEQDAENDGAGSSAMVKTESKSEKGDKVDNRYDMGSSGDGTKEHLDQLVSNIGMVSVQGMSDSRYLGSTSGISFARLVFAAVKSSVNTNGSENSSARSSERRPSGSTGSTMRDSFFGLQSRPSMKQAAFPERDLADKLVSLYFEHANPQMPILHRGDFMELLDRVYAAEESARIPRDMYLVSIVFAIGAGIIFEGRRSTEEENDMKNQNTGSPIRSSKKQKLSGFQFQPEEYHASAVVHLEHFLSSSHLSDAYGGGLDELQAVLLLASFALLRPVAPGLWYIVGVAVRLAIDLGLHHEDGTGIDAIGEDDTPNQNQQISPERGRFQWARDHRRRLWWCVYSFDRLVSACVGRPFGITDQVITTEFPSILSDAFITKTGFFPPQTETTSYKHVSYHYFKLRLLQSEIQEVLQFQQARFVRRSGKNSRNQFMHTTLPSPFLDRFDSFRSWRRDVHRRLLEWKDGAPTKKETGVQFSIELFELNFYQALIMLYRQSLTVPAALASELNSTEDVSSPPSFDIDDREDEDDIYLQLAEAGQKVIKIYRQLHRVRLVNYTYLTTHHLFMAGKYQWLFWLGQLEAVVDKLINLGISFLYAIWHSPAVRSRLTLDDVDFTVLAATSILSDLMEVCPPAETCRDAFERMSRATVRMGSKGFASQAVGGGSLTSSTRPLASSSHTKHGSASRAEGRQSHPASGQRPQRQARPPPQFDMNLNDLYNSPPNLQNQSPNKQQSYPPSQAAPAAQTNDSREPYQASPQFPQTYANYDRSPSQQQQYYFAQSPQSVTSVAGVSQSFTPPTQSDQQNLQDISLDFLDFVNMNQGSGAHADQAAFNPMGVQPLSQDNQGNGVNMGFGMEADYMRDLTTDGSGYDLMDGYWFGMSGGGSGI